MPRYSDLIIFQEKHGKRYFPGGSLENTNRAFLTILRERHTEGYWYYEPQELTLNKEDAEVAALTDEQLAALPAAVRENLEGRRATIQHRQQRLLAEYKRERAWWDSLLALLAMPEEEALAARKGNYPLAQDIYDERADYEYEGYTTENFG